MQFANFVRFYYFRVRSFRSRGKNFTAPTWFQWNRTSEPDPIQMPRVLCFMLRNRIRMFGGVIKSIYLSASARRRCRFGFVHVDPIPSWSRSSNRATLTVMPTHAADPGQRQFTHLSVQQLPLLRRQRLGVRKVTKSVKLQNHFSATPHPPTYLPERLTLAGNISGSTRS